MKNNQIWHPFTQHLTAKTPLRIVSGKNSLLFDESGCSYIDANSSWWVNVHGHGHPKLKEALSSQFETLDHVVFAGVTHPKAEELASKICSVLPSPLTKVFFSDNGSTAVEVALKMIIQYWYNQGESRKRILAIEGAYHGDTFGAMSVGQRGYFNAPFEDFFFDVDYVPFPSEENSIQIIEKIESLFKSNEFAGVIVEPLVQGASGMRMYSNEILDQIGSLARKYGVKIIFDEVMTGFGRTGKMFAMDHCAVKPDIVCLSKGLTGGVLPLGLTVATDNIFEAFLSENTSKALLHGHSFTGNAITCAVSCASLEIFEEESTWVNIKNLVDWNQEFSLELCNHERVNEVRQTGTILAFDLKSETGNSYFSDVRNKAYEYFLQHGILLRPLGNTIFINPPYCISVKEYGKIKNAIKSFLDEC